MKKLEALAIQRAVDDVAMVLSILDPGHVAKVGQQVPVRPVCGFIKTGRNGVCAERARPFSINADIIIITRRTSPPKPQNPWKKILII